MTFADPAPLAIAFGASATIALAAWRARSLSASGAIAAAVVGGVALAASWGMGLYLIVWFALATVLSKIGKRKKAQRMAGIVEKSSQRDAWQVLANGGVYLVCAMCVWAFRTQRGFSNDAADPILLSAAASLAASGADTWATEIGTLFGGAPWSLRARARVPTGTSGAITLAGSVAMLAGAIAFALLAYAFGLLRYANAPSYSWLVITLLVALGGIAGAFTDTLIGAWFQERKWCPRCTSETEQRVHSCGTLTVHHRGVRGLSNDVVNVLCSLVGALTPIVALLILTLIFEGIRPG